MDAIRLWLRGVHARLCVERGAIATEYGLLLTLIALAIIAAVVLFGASVVDLFERGVEPF